MNFKEYRHAIIILIICGILLLGVFFMDIFCLMELLFFYIYTQF